jgi:XTP/dITP diphosphohydrolase
MILYAGSTNPGKMKEFALAGRESDLVDLRIEPLPGIGRIPAPQENGATFEENAETKAAYYSGFSRELVFADDSGLEVDALNGSPGVLSARFAGEQATDEQNNDLLLRQLGEEARRSGRFVCVIALARRGEVLHTLRGSVEGEILRAPRGTGGFGYDPLFWYPPFGCSFAELTPERKFAVSHRGNAIRALFRWLSEESFRVNSD